MRASVGGVTLPLRHLPTRAEPHVPYPARCPIEGALCDVQIHTRRDVRRATVLATPFAGRRPRGGAGLHRYPGRPRRLARGRGRRHRRQRGEPALCGGPGREGDRDHRNPDRSQRHARASSPTRPPTGKAVTLAGNGSGQCITFTTPVATNSIDFRYSIPDSSDGSVYTAPLSLYVNGAKQPDLTLTNAYSWYYGSYPFSNTPGSNPHHFYDEAHQLFRTTYPAGTTFKLQVDSGDSAASYTINFADFENVGPALTQPAGSVSVTSKGADATGAGDSTAAFNAAIAAAGPGGTVWIPPGTFNIPRHITVNNVTVAGAGMWYSTVTGAAPGFYGLGEPDSCGVGGNTGPAATCTCPTSRSSAMSRTRNDCDQVNGIGGAMSNSTVVQHLDRPHEGRRLDGRADGQD